MQCETPLSKGDGRLAFRSWRRRLERMSDGKVRSEILSWYKIRNFVAHGEPPTQLADVPTVLYQANEVAGTLDDVNHALARGPV